MTYHICTLHTETPQLVSFFCINFSGDFGYVLFAERETTEIGFDIGHGQDTPIAIVWLVGDIVFRNGGQHVQRNAERLNAFDVSALGVSIAGVAERQAPRHRRTKPAPVRVVLVKIDTWYCLTLSLLVHF